jgi:hypothetical protein
VKSWEARRREARYWIMGLIVAVGVLLVFWAVVDGPQEWTKHQAVAAYLQTIILLGTAGIVWWYTEETRRLREAAQQQIEVQQRPFVIVTPETPQGTLDRLRVHNIGNSAALNVCILIDGESITFPKLLKGENVAGPVIPTDQGGITQAIHATQERYGEENTYDLRFPLRDASLTNGFQFTVEYQNVAMESYETKEKLWPRGFEIIHSGKRVPSSH